MRLTLLAALAALSLSLAPSLAFSSIVSVPSPDGTFQLVNVAHADEPTIMASPAASDVQKVAGKIEGVGAVIKKVIDSIPLSGPVILIAAFLYDLARRKWPTKNPASLWRDIKAVSKAIVSLLMALIAFLHKIDEFGDSVIGQNQQK